MKKKSDAFSFPGFRAKYRKDFFTYPNELTLYWMHLSGSEQKILDFILRQTLGFQKTSDRISVSQFVTGIGGKNMGTGVSKAQVMRALKSLEKKGFISVSRSMHQTNIVTLCLKEGEVPQAKVTPEVETLLDSQVRELISKFESAAPHMMGLYQDKSTHTNSIKKMLASYSFEQLAWFIDLALEYNTVPYAPQIHTPRDLERKFSMLVAFIKKEEAMNRMNNRGVIA